MAASHFTGALWTDKTFPRDPHGRAQGPHRLLYRFALKNVRDPALAEDLVQETFLAALAQAPANRFAGRSSVRTWLTGILKHKIADALRERARAPLSYDEAVGDHAAELAMLRGGDGPEGGDDASAVPGSCQRSLDRMSARAARAFVLTDVLGHETEEVCAMLGITSSNLWTTLHRVRQSLRRDSEAAQAA